MKPLDQFDAVDRRTRRDRRARVGRQFLRFAAQSIDHPRAERRPTDDAGDAAVKIANRNFVAVVAGVHRANEADVVDDAGGVRQQFGNSDARLAMFCEFEGTAQQFAAGGVTKLKPTSPS